MRKIQENRLVIAAQKDTALPAAQFNQRIDHAARIRAAVNVIADEDSQWVDARPCGQIGIDRGELVPQQVNTAVDVADRIDAHAVGRAKSRRNGLC